MGKSSSHRFSWAWETVSKVPHLSLPSGPGGWSVGLDTHFSPLPSFQDDRTGTSPEKGCRPHAWGREGLGARHTPNTTGALQAQG